MTKTSAFGVSRREGHDSSTFYNSRLYADANAKIDEQTIERENRVGAALDKILCADSRKMTMLPDECVHLVVTSPPYNVGKTYDQDLNLEEYLKLLYDVFSETYRVLVLGGRVCVNIANIGRKPYIPYHKFIIDIMTKIGFLMRGEIIWDKGAGAGTSTAWGSWKSASNPTLRDTHEYILVFSKGKFTRHKGKKENTINRDQFLTLTKSVWEFRPESAKKVGHPAPFPIELPFRCIQLYTFKDDVVLDPFAGVGSTAIAAIKAGRHYVCLDNDLGYVRNAIKRLRESK